MMGRLVFPFVPARLDIVSVDSGIDAAHAVTALPDGVLVAGRAWTPSGGSDLVLVRYLH